MIRHGLLSWDAPAQHVAVNRETINSAKAKSVSFPGINQLNCKQILRSLSEDNNGDYCHHRGGGIHVFHPNSALAVLEAFAMIVSVSPFAGKEGNVTASARTRLLKS